MDPRRKNPYRANPRRKAENSFLRIVRLLAIAASIVVTFTVVYFLFIGSINGDFLGYTIAAGTVLAIVVSVKPLEKKRLSDIGIRFRAVDMALFLCGALIAASWGIVYAIVAPLADGSFVAPQAVDMLADPSRLLAYFPIPLAEEMFFRGYVLGNTFPRLKPWQRSLLAAGLFTIPHIIPDADISSPVSILAVCVFTFLFGILLNLVVSFTESIWLGFGLRWGYTYVFTALFTDTDVQGFMVVVSIVLVLVFMLVFSGLINTAKSCYHIQR